MTHKPIFLVGMMGAGKSTLAKHIVQTHPDYTSFIDTDDYIENAQDESVGSIFKIKGESYFRALERQFLERFDAVNCVVATGGGMPIFQDNCAVMLAKGWVVYVAVPIPLLVARLWTMRATRPLLQSVTSSDALFSVLNDTLQQRKSMYAQAHLIVDGAASVEVVSAAIMEGIKKLSANP